MRNVELREYFATRKMPEHYPPWFNSKLGSWAQHHTEDDVKIYDIFELTCGKRVIVNEIRRITKHAIGFTIYEFIDRDTGHLFHFNDIDLKYCYD